MLGTVLSHTRLRQGRRTLEALFRLIVGVGLALASFTNTDWSNSL